MNRDDREEGEKSLDEELLTRLNIRPLAIGDLDAMVEIDRKVLGRPRLDFWKKRIELVKINRERGTYGNHDNRDMSHTAKGIVSKPASVNRGSKTDMPGDRRARSLLMRRLGRK